MSNQDRIKDFLKKETPKVKDINVETFIRNKLTE